MASRRVDWWTTIPAAPAARGEVRNRGRVTRPDGGRIIVSGRDGKRRLLGAVCAHQRDDFSASDGEIDIVKRLRSAESL
jgi:hypothetical protein